jgi:hypothetical protein
MSLSSDILITDWLARSLQHNGTLFFCPVNWRQRQRRDGMGLHAVGAGSSRCGVVAVARGAPAIPAT